MVKLSAGGAASGAMAGGYAGSAFGPAGTAVGAAAGGILGLFGGGKKKKKKRSTLDDRQQKLYGDQNAAIYGEGPLSDIYDYNPEAANEVFDKTIGRPAYRKFEENVIPKITGQFRGGNIQNSSYTGEALSRAGRDVQEGLDAQRSQYLYNEQKDARQAKRDAIKDVMNTQTFAYDTSPQEKGTIDQILESLGPEAGQWFADFLKSSKGQPRAKTGGGSMAVRGANIATAY